MRNVDFIPGADAQFNEWADNVVNMSMGQGEPWGYTTAAWDALYASYNKFKEKYTNASLPSSRTSAAVKAKNEARAAFEKALRAFLKSYVTYNRTIDNEYRVRMGLPVHRVARERVPVPTTYPTYKVGTSTLRHLKIHFQDAGSESKAKPVGVRGCEIRWGILDREPAVETELIHSNFATRTPFTLAFTEAERGKTVYFALRWENTRGEKGPFGSIQSAVIP